MSTASVPAVVSTSWLADQLTSGTTNIRILDATWDSSGKIGQQDYLKNHIEEASFLDLNQIMKVTSPTILRSVPTEQEFGDYVASLGVNSDDHVIVYDTHFFFSMPYGAARTWWLFRLFGHTRVSVLDGGIRLWMKEGRHTTTVVPNVQKGEFSAKFNPDLLLTYDQMVDNVRGTSRDPSRAVTSRTMMDTRLPGDFQGKQPEPCELIKNFLGYAGIDTSSLKFKNKGHMKHSVNISFPEISNEDTCGLKYKPELLTLFREKQVDLAAPLVTSCYVGMTACSLALAAAVCGKTDVPVYSGSWTEFAQRADVDLCEADA